MGIDPNVSIRAAAAAVAQDGKQNRPASSRSGGQSFRVGEILRGTIVDVAGRGAARVELPSGEVYAQVQSQNLRRGDSLLFAVQATAPKLLLRVEAIPVAIGDREMPAAEILRMLGQPTTPLNLEIVAFLREGESLVRVDVVRDLQQAVQGLRQTDIGEMGLRDTLAVLAAMRKVNIPLQPEFFARMRRVLGGTLNIARDLRELDRQGGTLSLTHPPIAQRAQTLFQDALSNFKQFLGMFGIKPLRAEQPQSLYELLHQYLQQVEASPTTAATRQVLQMTVALMEALEGQHLYNIHASRTGGSLLFNVALPIGDSLQAATIEIHPQLQSDRHGSVLSSFRVQSELSALGRVAASGTSLGPNLSITLLADLPQSAAALARSREQLVATLQQSGYHVRSLTVRQGDTRGSIPGAGGAAAGAKQGVNIVV